MKFGSSFDREEAENTGSDATTSTASIWSFRDGTTVVRFLDELEGDSPWTKYWEHYDQGKKTYYPCPGREVCPGCADGVKASKKYLVNAYVVESDHPKVKAGYVNLYKVPGSLIEKVLRRFDKYGTITDRDYEIFRTGQGLDTTYDMETGDKSSFDFAKYEDQKTDHNEALEAAWNKAFPSNDVPADVKAAAEPEPTKGIRKARPKTAEQVEDEVREQKQEESDFAKAKAGKTDPPSEPTVQSASADDEGDETVLSEESIRAMSVEELTNLYTMAGLEIENAKSGAAEDLAEYLIDTLGD